MSQDHNMRKHKNSNNELQLEFHFLNDDPVSAVRREVVHAPVPCRVKELPIMPKEEELELFEQVDALLQQMRKRSMTGRTKLYAFILCSFYVKGKSVAEIAQLLAAGVAGVPCVTRERVRMIVSDIRDELLSMSSPKKFTQGIVPSEELVEEMVAYPVLHTGHVVKASKWVTSPRLRPIAYLLHQKVVTGDSVIPWIKTEKILIDENIGKREFNAHYAGLFYLLQKEVRPMTYEEILRRIPNQKQMKGADVRGDLLSVLLQHDEVFEEVADGIFQLRAEHLNMIQRIARIIFEEKDATRSDLQSMYTERHGEPFSNMASVGRIYPWCVPVGKSKWVYREDGDRLRMPADVIREFCKEHVRFTLQEVQEHMESQGVNIKETSVRCYILRDCRSLNADGNTFCLTSEITESEKHLWRSKYATTTRPRKKEWEKKMEQEIRHVLASAPRHRMLRKKVLNQCKYIFEQAGISYNNFYKIVGTFTWLKATQIDGETYLELKKEKAKRTRIH